MLFPLGPWKTVESSHRRVRILTSARTWDRDRSKHALVTVAARCCLAGKIMWS